MKTHPIAKHIYTQTNTTTAKALAPRGQRIARGDTRAELPYSLADRPLPFSITATIQLDGWASDSIRKHRPLYGDRG
jgi:hypothetical protein